ncbi:efflux RND transporter periplasmic adaptor subunit [Ghiorsea bivora]|uniref:efflux RND transporter periplasmic adaptor subunit n=1 Tax=Ghiorsea bivora TaxID=1485545 RepID=UPI00056E08DC|nr:efflux RND transporter periplasmic adaptor subunit [Ghiorsea bivora]
MDKKILATMGLVLVLGVGGGYWLASQSSSSTDMATSDNQGRKILFYRNAMNPSVTSPVPAKDNMGMDYVPVYAEDDTPKEKKVLFYRNPMNPAITSPVPSKDEMGMDYIPVYADDGGDSADPAGTVRINPTMVQNIGVRTVKAKLETLTRAIRTVGRVTYDEERVARLHPKYNGWVEKMMVDKTGEHVHKGTRLMSIYSPQLVATQEEYILALKNVEMLKDSPFEDVRTGAASLLESAVQRLQFLDVPEHQIKQLKEERKVMKGLHIHSPFEGIVMKIGARDGQRITPGTELYMIADLSRVWVIVDLYEDDLPWVREGDMAEMKVAGIPGRTFTGKVVYIYPYLEAKTRTVKMRLEFDNPELALKPEMFANVTVKAGRQIDAVVVPSEAIVRTGEQEQVFVQRGPGKYEPRKVIVGIDSEGQAQIIEGLEAGEIVVTSSQFLIDSESKLKEATAKMMEATQAEPAAADMQMDSMDGMEMPDDMNMEDMQ